MALKGLDIFKLTPKKNCKECGFPTCMAFSMKVAAGGADIAACPYMSDDAKAQLSEATAPPMKTIKIGAGNAEKTLGGETVLYRHEATFVSKTLFGVCACTDCCPDKLDEAAKVDYERIGEREYVEVFYLAYKGDKDAYLDLVKKAMGKERVLVLACQDADVAAAALDICAAEKPVLNGATPENYAAMNEIATKYGVVLGVSAPDLDALYDTTAALEAAGNKNLILDVTGADAKETFANAVQVRRAAIKNTDRTFGYPSIVNVAKLAKGDARMQIALASMFVLKYGSIVVLENMTYATALPLFGLRQNVFTDPQKPMRVEPGIYPINGADENAPCAVTTDFALTYFLVSGELERSGVPVNLLIADGGGYSVLTSWAAGKFSAGSIEKFMKESDIEGKIKNRTLIIPGKVAVLKGEVQEKLAGWEIKIAPNEAAGLVKFMKDL